MSVVKEKGVGKDEARAGRVNRRTAWVLGVLVVGMFGFGFALVPLYSLFCQVVGINQIGSSSARQLDFSVSGDSVEARWVTVKFDATAGGSLPWTIVPRVNSLRVQVGKPYQVTFHAVNRSSHEITGQAIPSVVPWQATDYFQKTECFCFQKQKLAGGEAQDMGLSFVVSPNLPEGINSLTLSYNFMYVSKESGESARQPHAETSNEI